MLSTLKVCKFCFINHFLFEISFVVQQLLGTFEPRRRCHSSTFRRYRYLPSSLIFASQRRFCSSATSAALPILVVAEHDHHSLNDATLSSLTAADCLSPTNSKSQVSLLVVDNNCSSVVEQASKLDGITKVYQADNPLFEHELPENIVPLIAELHRNNE